MLHPRIMACLAGLVFTLLPARPVHAAPNAPALTVVAQAEDHLVLAFTPGASAAGSAPVHVDALLAVPSLDALTLSPTPAGMEVTLGTRGRVRGQPLVAVHVMATAATPPTRVTLSWHPATDTPRRMPAADAAFDRMLRTAVLNPAELAPTADLRTPVDVQPATVTRPHVQVNTAKLAIEQDGFYRLGYADLVAGGLDPATVDPATLQLWHQGVQVALTVTGAADGRFDADDSVIFYATAIPPGAPDAPYTTREIYQLTAGVVPGLRMAARSVPPAPAPDAFSFQDRRVAAEDTFYWVTMPPDAGSDRWFWEGRLAPNAEGIAATRAYTITIGAPVPSGTATLTARLQGVTTEAHATEFLLNGTSVGAVTWSGRQPYTHTVAIDQNLLRAGANRMDVVARSAGAEVDQILVDGFALTYRARYVAEDDALTFGAPDASRARYVLTGFSQPDIPLYDITAVDAPVLLTDVAWTQTGSTWTAQFTDDVAPAQRYTAVPPARLLTPAQVMRDTPSDWRTPGHGADYLLITHRELLTSTLRLAAHREAQGLRVATVLVEDLYDEFNHGVFNPGAIRDFLAYAYANWQPPAPTYVVLVGDAYQDYRNILAPTRNFVPSQIIQTDGFGETSSDTWFAAVDGDDVLPDLLLGRLPVKSPAELDAVIDKLIAYDAIATQAPQAWQRRVLLVADDDEAAFSALSTRLADHVPQTFTVQRIDVAAYAADDDPAADPAADIRAALDAGAVLVNYTGHGEYFRWGVWQGAPLLHRDEVAGLANGGALPVITMANCMSGFFTGPQDSLAEVLLTHATGGALAVWAPTDTGTPSAHTILMDGFYNAVLRQDQRRLGATVAAAQLATLTHSPFMTEMIRTYALLGDPFTTVQLAPNPPYVEQVTPPPDAQDVAIDATVAIVFSKRIDPATFTVSGLPDGTITAWDAAGRTVQLTPPSLAHGRTYTMTVAAQDGAGASLIAGPVSVPWRFTTSSDAIAPTVTLHAVTTPLTATTPLRLDFSEPVRPGSVVVDMTPLPPPLEEGEDALRLVWDEDGRSATLQHGPFAADVAYVVTVRAAKDRAGNALAAPVTATFTVAADPVIASDVFLPLITAP
ncbi:MAG: Ig-like domain-containing protein [Caldilineaceae bacterium]|nr:Ig-like domain-containing protein [Caldilineaceae bacterium]